MRSFVALVLLSLVSARVSSGQEKPSKDSVRDSVQTNVPSIDSVFAILDAYHEKRITASAAAKALADYVAGTHKALNIQMDAALRDAVEQELKKRGGP
jgi:hypothetical protein